VKGAQWQKPKIQKHYFPERRLLRREAARLPSGEAGGRSEEPQIMRL
jgi:hypothetical protein